MRAKDLVASFVGLAFVAALCGGTAWLLGLGDVARTAVLDVSWPEVIAGGFCLVWLFVLLKAPWDLFFQAQAIADEMASSRQGASGSTRPAHAAPSPALRRGALTAPGRPGDARPRRAPRGRDPGAPGSHRPPRARARERERLARGRGPRAARQRGSHRAGNGEEASRASPTTRRWSAGARPSCGSSRTPHECREITGGS